MFILLAVLLTCISASLKLSASGLELANKVSDRFTKESKSAEVAKIGIVTSATILKTIAFIVSRVRDLVSFIGSIVVVLDVMMISVLIVGVSSFLVLFGEGDVGGGIILNGTGQSVFYPSKGEANVSNIGDKPVGLSEESWSKADAIGKKLVSFACDSIINPPNGKYLLYQQGNTPQGYADCSVFICAVFEGSLNKTFTGGDAPNGYDFSVNRKSDLKGYVTTSGMRSFVNKHPEAKIGSTTTSLDLALPGDVLLTSGHVGMYVGKNEKGEHVMVHASSKNNPNCNGDINLADGQKLQVGFSKIRRSYDIIRPTKLLGY